MNLTVTSSAFAEGQPIPQKFTCQGQDVSPALKQTIIDGVLKEAKGRTVEQLADAENDVILGLLALRASRSNILP